MPTKTRNGDVTVQFTEPDNRVNLQSGESVKVLFGKIKKYFSDLKPVAFSGSYNDLSDKSSGVGMPSGYVTAFSSDNIPSGWLLCNGALISRTDYADLFSVIGTSYGAGDGTTTFALPNLQSRFPYGKGRNYALGATGGAETHTLTVAQIPSHTHSYKRFYYDQSKRKISDIYTHADFSIIKDSTTGATGSNQAHNNMPPYLVVNYIIKT